MHPFHQFRYCPKCGSALFKEKDFKAYRCESCGFVYYFNPSAATVALIVNERGEWLVARRAKDPAKGTLDLPGGFVDMYETAEEAVAREVLEETGMRVIRTDFMFTLPNTYLYSGFLVHTVDLFFRCEVENCKRFEAADDVESLFFIHPDRINAADFGLDSIRRAVQMIKEGKIK